MSSKPPKDAFKNFVLRVRSKRGTINQYIGMAGRSPENAENIFKHVWNGYEIEVRIPHHNDSTHETVFAPTERTAKIVATGRSGEYSDAAESISPLDIDVDIIETIPEDATESLKKERAIDEFEHIEQFLDETQSVYAIGTLELKVARFSNNVKIGTHGLQELDQPEEISTKIFKESQARFDLENIPTGTKIGNILHRNGEYIDTAWNSPSEVTETNKQKGIPTKRIQNGK